MWFPGLGWHRWGYGDTHSHLVIKIRKLGVASTVLLCRVCTLPTPAYIPACPPVTIAHTTTQADQPNQLFTL